MGNTPPRNRTDDSWPGNCTRCGTEIYHYASTCRECDRTERATLLADVGAPLRVVRSWLGWMRWQSYPRFVATVSAVAGIELLLTALWLSVLFSGAVALPTVS